MACVFLFVVCSVHSSELGKTFKNLRLKSRVINRRGKLTKIFTPFFLQSYLNCHLKFHTLILKLYCELFGTVCYLSEIIPSQTNSQV